MNPFKKYQRNQTKKIFAASFVSGIVSACVALFARSKKGQALGQKAVDFAEQKMDEANASIRSTGTSLKSKGTQVVHDVAENVEDAASNVKKRNE